MRQLLLFITLLFSLVAKAQDTTGVVTDYYQNGNKKSEGVYYRGYKIGFWQTWYEDGTVRSKENYSSNKELIDAIHKDGIVSQGYELDMGRYFVDSKGVFEGVSKWFHPNGQISAEELWSKEEVVVSNWDKSGAKEHFYARKGNGKPKGIWKTAEIDGKQWEKLAKQKWEAEGLKIKGTVLVSFMIEESGQIDNTKVMTSSSNPDIDALAMEIIKAIPVIAPAREHNLPAKSGYGFRVEFKNGVHIPSVF